MIASALAGIGLAVAAHLFFGQPGDRAATLIGAVAVVLIAMARIRPRLLVGLAVAAVVSTIALIFLRGAVRSFPPALFAFFFVLPVAAPVLLIAAAVRRILFGSARGSTGSRVIGTTAVLAGTVLFGSLALASLTWDWAKAL